MHNDKPAMWVVGIGLLVVLVTAVVMLVTSFSKRVTLQVGDAVLKVQPITTERERKEGLRGKSVALQEGFLFVFEQEEMWPILTENMKNSVDIVWMDANKKVVEVASSVNIGFQNEIAISKKRAKYALVIEEGAATRFNIRVGKIATFELVK